MVKVEKQSASNKRATKEHATRRDLWWGPKSWISFFLLDLTEFPLFCWMEQVVMALLELSHEKCCWNDGERQSQGELDFVESRRQLLPPRLISHNKRPNATIKVPTYSLHLRDKNCWLYCWWLGCSWPFCCREGGKGAIWPFSPSSRVELFELEKVARSTTYPLHNQHYASECCALHELLVQLCYVMDTERLQGLFARRVTTATFWKARTNADCHWTYLNPH